LQYTISPRNSRRVDVSDAGTVRLVALSEETAFTIDITHPIIDSTDRDTLLTFYQTNKNNTNTITLAGSTYDVLFAGDYAVESVSASYYTLSVTLVGTKQ